MLQCCLVQESGKEGIVALDTKFFSAMRFRVNGTVIYTETLSLNRCTHNIRLLHIDQLMKM